MLAGATLSSRRGRGERRITQRDYVGDDRREAAAALMRARGHRRELGGVRAFGARPVDL